MRPMACDDYRRMAYAKPRREEPPVAFETATVDDAMTRGVISCLPETSLRVVARTMATCGVHAVFVFERVDEGDAPHLWGVVSDLDLVAAAQLDLDELTAGEAAVTPLVTVASADSSALGEADSLMAQYGIAHLPRSPAPCSPRHRIGVISNARHRPGDRGRMPRAAKRDPAPRYRSVAALALRLPGQRRGKFRARLPQPPRWRRGDRVRDYGQMASLFERSRDMRKHSARLTRARRSRRCPSSSLAPSPSRWASTAGRRSTRASRTRTSSVSSDMTPSGIKAEAQKGGHHVGGPASGRPRVSRTRGSTPAPRRA